MFQRKTIGIATAAFFAVTLWAFVSPQDAELVFFGNLHSHTSYSDGSATPEEAFEHARDVAQIDFLALTEHSHGINIPKPNIADDNSLYSGPSSLSLISTANRFNQDDRFIAFYGQEFSSISSGNHSNVFEVGEVIDVSNGEYSELLTDWLPKNLDSTGQQALLLLNHPATGSSPNDKEYGFDDFDTAAEWRKALDARAQLINIINGPSHRDGTGLSPGRPSESEFRRYLSLGFHLAPTADQDNHRQNWGNSTDARTAVIATELSKEALLEAMRQRRVYATEDKNLKLVAKINGQMIGSRFKEGDFTAGNFPSQGQRIVIDLHIDDGDEPSADYEVQVFHGIVGGDRADVAITQDLAGNGDHSLQGPIYGGGHEYLFLKIHQTDSEHDTETDRAWLAPWWFEPSGMPAEPPLQVALLLEVDLVAEEAQITNLGDLEIDMSGCELISVRGDQRFRFDEGFKLQAGSSVLVTSGPNHRSQPPSILDWTSSHVWRNSGDPAELRNKDGDLIAEQQ